MIKIVKISTAEELVGDIIDHENEIEIKEPCAIAMIPSQSSLTSHSMGLIPYAGYTKGHTVTIKKDKIVWIAEPVEELYNQYNSIFGTGIKIFT
jgi:hypothetical protein